MAPSWVQLLIVLVIVLVLFGVGRVSGVMGEFGKGIAAFKKGMKDADKPEDTAAIEKKSTDGEG